MNELTYEFFVTRIRVSSENPDKPNLIRHVEWACDFTKYGLHSVAFGETWLEESEAEFTPITEVCCDQVISWVIEKEGGQTFINMLSQIHEQSLDQQNAVKLLGAWDLPLQGYKEWVDPNA